MGLSPSVFPSEYKIDLEIPLSISIVKISLLLTFFALHPKKREEKFLSLFHIPYFIWGRRKNKMFVTPKIPQHASF